MGYVLFLLHLCFFCLITNSLNIPNCLNLNEGERPAVSFVHVFKTGGSTLREIFRNYAEVCGYSLAILVNCNLKSYNITDPHSPVPCDLKELHNYKIEKTQFQENNKTPKYLLADVDISVGHFDVTVPYSLSLYSENNIHNRKKINIGITWFREPLSMLVSASIFLMSKKGSARQKNLKYKYMPHSQLIEEIISKMKVKLRNSDRLHGAEGHYSQYTNYFLGDGEIFRDYREKDWINIQHHPHHHTQQQTPIINLIDRRSLDFNIATAPSSSLLGMIEQQLEGFQVVGVIENMETSFQMLRATLDPSDRLGDNFWNHVFSIQRNKSKLRSADGTEVTVTDVIRYMERNSSTFRYFQEALKFETDIYHLGIQAHSKLCRLLQHRIVTRLKEFESLGLPLDPPVGIYLPPNLNCSRLLNYV